MTDQESMMNILNETQNKGHEKGYEEGVRDGLYQGRKEALHYLLQKMDLPRAMQYLHLSKEEADQLLK